MQSSPNALLGEVATVWQTLLEHTPHEIRQCVASTVERKADALATCFYGELMAVPQARQFLSHDTVQQRLHREMQRWLIGLYQVNEVNPFDAYVAHQVAVGAVHARIKLPIELLAIAFHVLGRELRDHLVAALPDANLRALAVHYSMALMSLANGLILSAFVREVERGVRNDEAYRHISFKHDAKFERERQRAALSEWAQRVLMAIPLPQQRATLTPLARSEFAQWLKHKGQVMFEGIEDLASVTAAMNHIDTVVMPLLNGERIDGEEYPRLIQALDSKLQLIRYVMNDLFDRVTSLDAGRDSVTRLLNRRYLHSILAREVETHIAAAAPFAVLMVRVRESVPPLYDSADGERRSTQLQRVAACLTDYGKAGDHLFRYSDQDFLIVEVEVAEPDAMTRARLLLQKLQGTGDGFRIGIAVVPFDGHPDYQQLLRRAEFGIASSASQPADVVVRA